MDGSAFDGLAKTLIRSGSRRRALGGLLAGGVGLLAAESQDAVAHDLKARCRKKSGKAKKTCRKKARKHAAQHAPRTPVSVPTYQCQGPRENNASGNTPTARLAQSFTAGVSGQLHQIQIGVHHDAGTTGDYVVEILDLDVDGKPTNTVLATATVPNATVPVDPISTVTANFAGPPLVAGLEYAAAISRPGATRNPSFYVNARSPDDCAGSGFSQDPRGSGQFVPLAQDLVLSVFVLV